MIRQEKKETFNGQNHCSIGVACRSAWPVEVNLQRAEKWIRRAAAQGASFVGFPEFSLSGYDDMEDCRHVG